MVEGTEMDTIDELTALIIENARQIAAEQDIEADAGVDAGTRLFGEDGLFDSMALVSLVVAVEQAIEEKYGVAVSLADEKALSQRNSPYRTVATLAQYAATELRSRQSHG